MPAFGAVFGASLVVVRGCFLAVFCCFYCIFAGILELILLGLRLILGN